jgi:hypothetical protein
MKKYSFLFLVFSLLYSLTTTAQTITADDNTIRSAYPFLTISNNTISNSQGLDSFYKKLATLKRTHKGVVRIVHIGDSHIQADILSGTVRTKLQQYFGNAGRGLIFPYQLAKSNAPVDISCSSNIIWKFNRLAHPEIPITSGIAGFCIKTDTASKVIINLAIKQSFDHLQFFFDSSATASPIKWELHAGDKSWPLTVNDSAFSRDVYLKQPVDSFSITSSDTSSTRRFFGVSVDNSEAGVLYHTIGVNGATYNEYNMAPLFWKQLGTLNADLYIVSMGTNEGMKSVIAEDSFQTQVLLFIQNLKAVSPNAEVIITTTADSYKNGKYNVQLDEVNCLLSQVGNQNNIPVWDMYNITGGHQSADCWRDNKCMNKDFIHYLPNGYQIQGSIFFDALAKGYNNYINNH